MPKPAIKVSEVLYIPTTAPGLGDPFTQPFSVNFRAFRPLSYFENVYVVDLEREVDGQPYKVHISAKRFTLRDGSTIVQATRVHFTAPGKKSHSFMGEAANQLVGILGDAL